MRRTSPCDRHGKEAETIGMTKSRKNEPQTRLRSICPGSSRSSLDTYAERKACPSHGANW